MDRWVITDVETDEPIMVYSGSFMDVMNFVNGRYEDGIIDIESYKNWLNRQQKEENMGYYEDIEKLHNLKERATYCEDGSDKEYKYYEAYLKYKYDGYTDSFSGETIYTKQEGMGW